MQNIVKADVFFYSDTYAVFKFILYLDNPETPFLFANKEEETDRYEHPRLEVAYTHLSYQPVAALQFSLDKYIAKGEKGWKLTPAFSNYKLTDTTQP